MVAHPGPDVLIPALASVYVVVAVPVPTLGLALCVKRVSVNGARILTPWRRPKIDPLHVS
jgi:hypothetical protein